MSFVNQNQFPCILFFFSELKDQLLSIGKGGGGLGEGAENI